MITKYFTKVVVRFNPFGTEARAARNFLAQIPPTLRGTCAIEYEVLNSQSKNKPIVQVYFKDKEFMEADPTKLSLNDLNNLFDRHSRKLQFKDEVSS
ncbi:unnamed protein product [[Candida] boidinii]|uniref:Large ribosomal subunit protein mL53 n=1 Tax=Candida boidinii TaxID=5477 RepID=A0A9W6T4W5_CANBO|nr:hypothetical protein BVG19_g58 [[Candida] boidinii]OWB49626.1 hypothetical protein B5S27_g1168 [[Candida] boidinii]OWB65221.1 hypothetical protein B5S30_g545 [[Candida] boidinii]OWB85743.1 hypothetical protein B5S33_g4414 [[Candida] boidinii]GME74893.1 unnamed protein product [[Candida] boidinii]